MTTKCDQSKATITEGIPKAIILQTKQTNWVKYLCPERFSNFESVSLLGCNSGIVEAGTKDHPLVAHLSTTWWLLTEPCRRLPSPRSWMRMRSNGTWLMKPVFLLITSESQEPGGPPNHHNSHTATLQEHQGHLLLLKLRENPSDLLLLEVKKHTLHLA